MTKKNRVRPPKPPLKGFLYAFSRRLAALCLALTLCLIPFTAWAAPSWPASISIDADGGILMDASNKAILYGKNIDQPYYPASITKILTALIAIESCDLDEIVTFSHDAVYNVEEGSSNAGIDEGDTLTVRDCLYALLLASANESANALAEHISGSREAFAQRMNEKAASLGCTGSHFANPSGLNDENHYTTAHDMALITRAAIENPTFVEICGARTYRLQGLKRVSPEEFPQGYPIANHHKMWSKNDPVYYEGAFCGKTGYTSLAGNTLVTCAKRGDMTLIAVILNGHQTHYADTKALLDFGFNNFQSLAIEDYETTYTSIRNDMEIGGIAPQDGISLSLAPGGTITLPKTAAFSDAVPSLNYDLPQDAPKTAVAQITYTLDGHFAGSSYLCSEGGASLAAGESSPSPAAKSGPQNGSPHASEGESAKEKADIHIPFKLIAACALILAAVSCAAALITIRRRRQNRLESDHIRLHQRRRERLDDNSYSSSEFDRIMEQYRTYTTTSYTRGTGKRGRRSRRRRFPFKRRRP